MKVFKRFVLVIIIFLMTFCVEKNNKKDFDTPNVGIHQAIVVGDIEAVQQHIKAGTDINEDEWTHGSSPLITASAFGEIGIADLLIKNGADLDFQNDEGSTALITATAFNKPKAAQLLVKSGSNVDIVNNDGSTALIVSVLLGNIDIVKSLLDKGADKQIKNNYGRSAISIAESSFENVKEILLKLEERLQIKFDYERIKTNRPVIAEMMK